MLKIAALVLAAASATQTPALKSGTPWWEKVTVTLTGDGKAQSCVISFGWAELRHQAYNW